MIPRRPMLVWRLLLVQIVPLILLAAALATAGGYIAHRVVEKTSDRLLAASVAAIIHQVDARGDLTTAAAVSPWTLGLLDAPERDAVFYSVRQGDRLITGYQDLPAAPVTSPLNYEFGYGRMRGMTVRIASGMVDAPTVHEPVIVTVAQTLDSRRVSVGELLSGLIALPVLLIAAAALLIWPATMWGLRPLGRLVQQLTRQSASRRPDYRPASTDHVPAELTSVVVAYNGLLANLERSANALDSFAADASHQLRTPLSVITANLALLAANPARKDAADLVQDSRNASDRLHMVLRQLLSLARADAAAVSGVTDLREAVVEAVRQARRSYPDQDIRIRVPIHAVMARGDATLIHEMLINLLNNAATYGQSPIMLSLSDEGVQPVLTLWDSGPGIDDNDLASLSRRFFRGDNALGSSGAGLGLAIVSSIADAFDARVELCNRQRRSGLIARIVFQRS